LDIDNLYLGARDAGPGGASLEFGALLSHAGSLGRVVTAAAFLSRSADDSGPLSLPIALKHLGYDRVVLLRRRRMAENRQKSACDIALTMDAWAAVFRREIDVLVLGSGDGDFLPLVDRTVELGLAVHVIGPNGSTAPELLIAATRFLNSSDVTGFFRTRRTSAAAARPAPRERAIGEPAPHPHAA